MMDRSDNIMLGMSAVCGACGRKVRATLYGSLTVLTSDDGEPCKDDGRYNLKHHSWEGSKPIMERLYIVHGPTAEWADGVGPLAYFDSVKDAASYVRSERRFTIDHAAEIAYGLDATSYVGGSLMSEDDAQRLILAFLATENYSRRAYDLAAKICGWPTDLRDYYLECVSDVGAFLRSVDFDGDIADTDAILEWLNEN